MRWIEAALVAALTMGACNGLPDYYGGAADAFSQGVPFEGCTTLLTGHESEPVVVDIDSPCFGAWGEWLEVARADDGVVYLMSRSRALLEAVDDSYGPHYGEVDAYAKWSIPTSDGVANPYEIQVFIEPDDVATTSAKYKVWTPEIGTCFQTVSQRVTSPQWVSLGIFPFGRDPAAMRINNTTPDVNETAHVQFGKVRFIRSPVCGITDRGTHVSDAERCDDGACAVVTQTEPGSDFVLNVERGDTSPYRVRLRETLSGRDVTMAVLGEEEPCVEGGSGEFAFVTQALLPASHLAVELYDGCEATPDEAPAASMGEIIVAACGRSCPGY